MLFSIYVCIDYSAAYKDCLFCISVNGKDSIEQQLHIYLLTVLTVL